MEEHIYPRERDYDEFTSDQNNLWQYPDWYEGSKRRSKKTGDYGIYFYQKNMLHGVLVLTNLEIAGLFETMSSLHGLNKSLIVMRLIEAIWKY